MQYEPAGLTSDPDVPRVTSLSDYVAQRLAVDYLTPQPMVVDLTDAAGQVIQLPEQQLRKRATRSLTSVARRTGAGLSGMAVRWRLRLSASLVAP